jgi:hypothetical protein
MHKKLNNKRYKKEKIINKGGAEGGVHHPFARWTSTPVEGWV